MCRLSNAAVFISITAILSTQNDPIQMPTDTFPGLKYHRNAVATKNLPLTPWWGFLALLQIPYMDFGSCFKVDRDRNEKERGRIGGDRWIKNREGCNKDKKRRRKEEERRKASPFGPISQNPRSITGRKINTTKYRSVL